MLGPWDAGDWLGRRKKKKRADWVALGFLGRVLGFSWAGGFGLLGSFLFFYFFSFPLNSKLFEFKRI